MQLLKHTCLTVTLANSFLNRRPKAIVFTFDYVTFKILDWFLTILQRTLIWSKYSRNSNGGKRSENQVAGLYKTSCRERKLMLRIFALHQMVVRQRCWSVLPALECQYTRVSLPCFYNSTRRHWQNLQFRIVNKSKKVMQWADYNYIYCWRFVIWWNVPDVCSISWSLPCSGQISWWLCRKVSYWLILNYSTVDCVILCLPMLLRNCSFILWLLVVILCQCDIFLCTIQMQFWFHFGSGLGTCCSYIDVWCFVTS